MDNLTPVQMVNSPCTYTLDVKTINNGRNTLYLDVYKDNVYIITRDENIVLCTDDREKAFKFFEA